MVQADATTNAFNLGIERSENAFNGKIYNVANEKDIKSRGISTSFHEIFVKKYEAKLIAKSVSINKGLWYLDIQTS